MDIIDQDLEYLRNLEKVKETDERYSFPTNGSQINIPLISKDGREKFFLDLTKASINLSKITAQNRARVVIQLARLNFGGSPHRNPDGEKVGVPHIHLYKEGYGDTWAYPAKQFIKEDTLNSGNFEAILDEFMDFCCIVEKPKIQFSLFTNL